MEPAFETMSSEELFRIPTGRRIRSFTASRSTLGFERIEHAHPHVDLTKSFSISPYPTEEQVNRAYANKEDELPARWLFFFSSTYLHGGYIRFRKLDDATFEVQ